MLEGGTSVSDGDSLRAPLCTKTKNGAKHAESGNSPISSLKI